MWCCWSGAGSGVRLVLGPHHPANADLVRYLASAVTEAGVDVRLGVDAGVDTVAAERPDVVIVATGARRDRPALPGGDLPHVLSGDDLRALLDGDGATTRSVPGAATGRGGLGARFLLAAGRLVGALEDPDRLRRLSRLWMPVGRRVTVIGGGLVGVELAAFLAERGRKVTLLEACRSQPLPELSKQLGGSPQRTLALCPRYAG